MEYQLKGHDLQYIEMHLMPGEAAVAEAGALFYMDDGITLTTLVGDGRKDQGMLSKLVGVGRKALSGESLFLNLYENQVGKEQIVSFAAPYLGTVVPVYLPDVGGSLLCQKGAFLCAQQGVALGVATQTRLGAALWGADGLWLQRLSGPAQVFIHVGGAVVMRDLARGEVIRVDSGCVAAFSETVDYDIKYVGKVRSAMFSGMGLFHTVLRGPGRVWLQSVPFSRMAKRMQEMLPELNKKQDKNAEK